MKIAIAGAGDVAKYLVEESLLAGHEVVVISRRKPEWFDRSDVDFRLVDYSVPSLVQALNNCDGVVSTIMDYSMQFAVVHLALLEACRQSRTCKRFIPSEFAGNIDDFPKEPAFYFTNHEPVRKALREQTEVSWTLFNLGWLTDYFVPVQRRYIKDIGDFHPVNWDNKTVIIPGTGDELIAFTPIQDACRALVRLFDYDKWDTTIYVCGENTTWNTVAATLSKQSPGLKVSHVSQKDLQKQIDDAETEDKVLSAQYAMWSISGAAVLPQEKLNAQKQKYFNGLKFRTIEEYLKRY